MPQLSSRALNMELRGEIVTRLYLKMVVFSFRKLSKELVSGPDFIFFCPGQELFYSNYEQITGEIVDKTDYLMASSSVPTVITNCP